MLPAPERAASALVASTPTSVSSGDLAQRLARRCTWSRTRLRARAGWPRSRSPRRPRRAGPGAATMSPARNTPSPRSTAGRSRQVLPGMSSAPERASITWRRRQVSRSRQSSERDVEQPLQPQRPPARRSRRGRIGICAWISSSPAGAIDAVGGRVAPDPAGLVHVRDDRTDRRGGWRRPRSRHSGVPARPAQATRRPAASRACVELGGDDHRRLGQLLDAACRSRSSTPSSRTRRSSVATSALQPPIG